jgi:nicotinamide riboside kinase
MRIAILGAECTGKTTLAQTLARALDRPPARAHWVPETLRDWCRRHARTPAQHEQSAIAVAQARAIDQAGPGDVLADTTPLMTAVYSDVLFQDRSLYQFALAHHAGFDITLLADTDLPWMADGLQRDGPAWRDVVNARLRQVLNEHALPYALIQGKGEARAANALAAIERHRTLAAWR